MIFLCGIPTEPSLALVIEALEAMGAPHVVFHQRRFPDLRIDLVVGPAGVRGEVAYDGVTREIGAFDAVYTRLMDWRLLPELEAEPPGSPARVSCEGVHLALAQWHELAPGRVLSRSGELGACYSKPLQGQIIRRHGFAVPETLVTNDPDAVRAFRRRHGRVVYKSSSYVRSIVDVLEDDDADRLRLLQTCPVLFQQFVPGSNLRVHTVAGRAFATAIRSNAVDYRYAHLAGESERLEAVPIADDLAERCLALAGAFALDFAGIDLRVTPEGAVYCLEVNPSPAFGYYQLHTGQPIAAAVASYLATGRAA